MDTLFYTGSPQVQAMRSLFFWTLVIGGFVFLLVTALVLVASIRYRQRSGGEPPQIFGNLKLEIGWTIAPALLLAFLFGWTLQTMHVADPAVAARSQDPDLVIVAHQWWWEVHYPKSGVVTANEIHLPAEQKILTRFESADVIHSFWVPEIARKMDVVPGHPNYLWIEVNRPGLYQGACYEFCGAQHAWMRIRVVAQSSNDFAAWQQAQLQTPTAPVEETAVQGQQLFRDKTCMNCHTVAGSGADEQIGPDLTHFASRATLGAGVLDNTPPNLNTWLTNPQAIKPGSHMPNLKLSDADANALTAYLETLK